MEGKGKGKEGKERGKEKRKGKGMREKEMERKGKRGKGKEKVLTVMKISYFRPWPSCAISQMLKTYMTVFLRPFSAI